MTVVGAKQHEKIDLRCPIGPRRLLARTSPTDKSYTDDGLIELPCPDCRANYRSRRDRKPLLILHRYNILGELVETETVWPTADNAGELTSARPPEGDTR